MNAKEPVDVAYLEALSRQAHDTESFELTYAGALADLLGDQTEPCTDLLFPLTCQSCGDPMVGKAEVCADGPTGDGALLLSLHHVTCRKAGVRRCDELDLSELREPTAMGVSGAMSNVPVVLINPSVEQVLLRRRPGGRWYNATLEPYLAAGFRQVPVWPQRIATGTQLWLREKALAVGTTVGSLHHPHAGQGWQVLLDPLVKKQILWHEAALVGFTSSAYTITDRTLEHILFDPQVHRGWVPIAP